MCGLAALFDPGRVFEPALLEAMAADLHHRGPDSGGRLAEPGLALVFRRLAILDPGAGADQPMLDPDTGNAVVFNGEIYNYCVLREMLERAGHRFRTTGDTEVLLAGYREWGESVVERLEGMFAFVLVDRRRNAAVAARDPFGIKPLYLARAGSATYLASEMRPLLRLLPAEPDPEALAELMVFNWAAGRQSNLRGIDRVPPGTLITVSLDSGALHERRYLDILDTLASPRHSMDFEEAAERIDAVVLDSVQAHLASDVGYTIQLSGGVDSSLLTAMVAGRTTESLASFSVDLPGYAHNERRWREPVVERYDLDHREVPMTGRVFAEALPRAVRHMEGPVPHGGDVNLMLLCDVIRERSKVVLTGEGADEMFGGYERYGLWRKLMWQERLGRLLPRGAWPKVRPFIGIGRIAGCDAAVHASVYQETETLEGVFPDLVPRPGPRALVGSRFRNFRDRLLAQDQTAYLESLLVRQDKMSMAASVEARVPYVHLSVLRLANSLPHRLRIPGGVTKPLLKRVAERYLPRDLIYRRKIGLWLPLDQWLTDEGGLGRYLDDVTAADGCLAAFGDRGRLRRLVEDYRRRPGSVHPRVMFKLVNLEVWLRTLAPGAA